MIIGVSRHTEAVSDLKKIISLTYFSVCMCVGVFIHRAVHLEVTEQLLRVDSLFYNVGTRESN